MPAMQWIGHLGLRQRFLWAYTAIVCAAAAVVWWIWPAGWHCILAMLAASVAAAWVVARALTWALRRRVRMLREATEAVSRGELDHRIDVLARDDFVKLAESLDRMVQQLRETVHEREHLRRKLDRSEKLALIGELAASVAHEINNPLDGLQNSTRIIRDDLPAIEEGNRESIDRTRQLLDLMETGLYRIEMIVRRLLTMSRDEPISAVPTRLDEIVSDAVLFVRPKLDRNRVELLTDFPAEPVFAQADRLQLVQVVINLMINAADAMPDGGKLVVRGRSDGDRGRAILEIIDTGHGIDEKVLPHIFEPFYTTKDKGAGTGLGLSVVARIVEAHGGAIDVTSDPGRGTRFHIELPAPFRTPSASEGQQSESQTPARGRSQSPERQRVGPIAPRE